MKEFRWYRSTENVNWAYSMPGTGKIADYPCQTENDLGKKE